jgi:hypothetical protein
MLRVEDGLLKGEAQCVFQAWFNKDGKYQHQGLRVVYGSLGIGVQDPYYELGGPEFTTIKQFMGTIVEFAGVKIDLKEFMNTKQKLNVHCWLEDGSGKVYDIVQSNWRIVAALHGKTLSSSLKSGDALEGMSRKSLQRLGLHYIDAPEPAHTLLSQIAHRLFAEQYQHLLDSPTSRTYGM